MRKFIINYKLCQQTILMQIRKHAIELLWWKWEGQMPLYEAAAREAMFVNGWKVRETSYLKQDPKIFVRITLHESPTPQWNSSDTLPCHYKYVSCRVWRMQGLPAHWLMASLYLHAQTMVGFLSLLIGALFSGNGFSYCLFLLQTSMPASQMVYIYINSKQETPAITLLALLRIIDAASRWGTEMSAKN